ncbi:hypothetical protein ACFQJ7_13255 [Halovenus rubra]|uniref:Uncharacterized protein n=2 Tax=Halovenus rubra TaxID=869890 RepID=A0ACC7E0W1_9EURY|nr:hypothetical protein [Halovenus rubra]
MKSGLPDAVIRFGAGLGFVMTYALPVRYNIGPEGRWWESVRQSLSHLGAHVDTRMGPRPITVGEYAGTLNMPPAVVDTFLWEQNFVRNPFSRVKTLGGRSECGSWVYRESPLANRQLHVMLFATDDARTDVYAHEESSSVNPDESVNHVDGTGQNVAVGVEWARERLPLDVRKETADPPAGPWTESVAESGDTD